MLRSLARFGIGPLLYGAVVIIIGSAIVHLAWTLAMPAISRKNSINELLRAIGPNSAILLPPITHATQPMPFLSADRRYALCHYDVREGVVHLQARLAGLGWSLAMFGRDAQNFYYLGGQNVRQTSVSLILVAGGDRNVGALARARQIYANTPELVVPTQEGLVVLMAPDDGAMQTPQIEADMAQFRCTLVRSAGIS